MGQERVRRGSGGMTRELSPVEVSTSNEHSGPREEDRCLKHR